MAGVESISGERAAPQALRDALGRYGEALLRPIASQYARPRLQWSADEMCERIVSAIGDSTSVDRALKGISSAARQLLKVIGMSRQFRWSVPALSHVVTALEIDPAAAPVLELLTCGLLVPELTPRAGALTSFEAWLANGSPAPLWLHAAPLAALRARRESLPLPKIDFDVLAEPPREADGLDWPLRIAVAWQTIRAVPLRLTQAKGLFKRDLDRLQTHPLLSAAAAEEVGATPDAALLAVSLALALGALDHTGDEIVAGKLPASWADGLGPLLTEVWSAFLGLDDSLCPRSIAPGVAVLALALLDDLPRDQWALADDVDTALKAGGAATTCLLGIAQQLRIVQATQHKNRWWVRLTDFGRDLVGGKSGKLPAPPGEQTLLVQPNLEIVLFRQGVSPELILRVSQFAEWKSLGSACTLTLTADSVYRGLESGQSLSDILGLLERHGTRALSDNVIGTLRSWASKRERVVVFPSALVLEFRTSDDLDRALRQGLVEYRVAERIGVIGSETGIDYQQFRLIGSRDYLAPDELCVEIERHGLAVAVNENKSDLLLESELRRFAEPVERNGDDRPRFQMSIESLRKARRQGLNADALDAWFRRRAGTALPAAAKLLISGDQSPPFGLSRIVVLRVPNAELADGIVAWPETAPHVAERLSPTLLAVADDQVDSLLAILGGLGVQVDALSE